MRLWCGIICAAVVATTCMVGAAAVTEKMPPVASAKMPEAKHVFSMSPDAAALRKAFREAGAHVWMETDDVIAAGRGYLTVHASSAGAKEIRLPAPCNVSEIFGAEPKRDGVVSFSTKMSFGQTLVYSLHPLLKQNVSKP